MTSIKNPEQEAEHPAPTPKDRQGQSGTHGGAHEHKAKMAVHSDSPPGIELDGKAHVIPVEQRTKADREKAKKAR